MNRHQFIHLVGHLPVLIVLLLGLFYSIPFWLLMSSLLFWFVTLVFNVPKNVVKVNPQPVKITGKITGDCQCWCLEVTEEEYRRIVGEDTYKIEIECRKELENDPFMKEMAEKSGPDRWLLYPSDFMKAIGCEDGHHGEVTFEIKRVN